MSNYRSAGRPKHCYHFADVVEPPFVLALIHLEVLHIVHEHVGIGRPFSIIEMHVSTI
jgi:hypothetical protein